MWVPIGLIVLGILESLTLGRAIYDSQDTISWIVIGIIISAIGVLLLIIKKRKDRKVMDTNLPRYLEIVDALKNIGYEVDEFEHKKDRIRTNVLLNGKRLGEIFLVAPSRNAQFQHIKWMTDIEFKSAYYQKFGKSPGMSASYWPEGIPIGAMIEKYIENYTEKGIWLSKMTNIFNGETIQEVVMSDLEEKKEGGFPTAEAAAFVQSEVSSILFYCPKCDCTQTKVTGKRSWFGALGGILLKPIVWLISLFMPIKIFIYLVSGRYKEIKKMILQDLYSTYILGWKELLLLLTFGLVNLTRVYTCEKCGKKWVI